jgi:hypothetical protein
MYSRENSVMGYRFTQETIPTRNFQEAIRQYRDTKKDYDSLISYLEDNSDVLNSLDEKTRLLIQTGVTIQYQNYVNTESFQAKILPQVTPTPPEGIAALIASHVFNSDPVHVEEKVTDILDSQQIAEVPPPDPELVPLVEDISAKAGSKETKQVSDDLKKEKGKGNPSTP